MMGESAAKPRVLKRIEELSERNREVMTCIQELEELGTGKALDDMDFEVLRRMLLVFRANIDGMSVEEKRAAIRTVVRKVIWDGTNVHLVLFGAEEGVPELPDGIPNTPWGEGSKY